MHETFSDLVRSPGHWAFEIFLMVGFDGLILGILWPFLRKHWKHHTARDRAENTFQTVIDWAGSHPSHVMGSDLWPNEVPSEQNGEFALVINGGPNAIRHQGK